MDFTIFPPVKRNPFLVGVAYVNLGNLADVKKKRWRCRAPPLCLRLGQRKKRSLGKV
jgi:hypothetical protein